MAEHNLLGKKGEDIACEYLISKEYRILERNWTWRKLELDIIAEKDNSIIFVEIKTRRNSMFGVPEDAVTDKKIRRIINAADAYIKKNKIDMSVRFDIISITGNGNDFQIKHIEDAFISPVW